MPDFCQAALLPSRWFLPPHNSAPYHYLIYSRHTATCVVQSRQLIVSNGNYSHLPSPPESRVKIFSSLHIYARIEWPAGKRTRQRYVHLLYPKIPPTIAVIYLLLQSQQCATKDQYIYINKNARNWYYNNIYIIYITCSAMQGSTH